MATYRKRGTRWQAQVRRQGFPPLSATFDRKAEAEAWARQREAELGHGETNGRDRHCRNIRLADLLNRYENAVTPTKKSQEVERYYLRALAADPIGEVTLDKLTPGRLAMYRDARLAKVKPSSVRREFNVLRHCLEVAYREWHVGLRSIQ